jgi:GT2 family glycosyltransferase
LTGFRVPFRLDGNSLRANFFSYNFDICLMNVSVMITTKNRVEDLKRTCEILRQLDPPPVEILITADGCTDGTVEFAREQLPNARLIVNEEGKGSVYSRNIMMREARGDLVLALDDDSYPEQLDCIARIISIFETRPQLGVLHFPQRTDEYPETLSRTDFGPAKLTRSFANSGAVLSRAIYMQLPGFEPSFFHMYEEPDYALQCVAAGYEVYYSSIVTIRHHYSGQTRSEMRNHQRHSRNELWSALLRCPFPQVVALIGYRLFAQFRYACLRGWSWAIREPVWWWQAWKGVPYCLKKRNPVPWTRYLAWLRLS